MAITPVRGSIYQKVNGALVKVMVPDTDVDVKLYGGVANQTLETVIADIETRLGSLGAINVVKPMGVVDSSNALPAADYEIGWLYRVNEAGTYAGQACEVGDFVYCLTSYVEGSASDADWTVWQGNIDGAVVGPDVSVESNFAVFDGVTGKVIKDSGISSTKIASMDTAIGTAQSTADKGVADAATAQAAADKAQGEVDALEGVVTSNKQAADQTQTDLDTLEAAYEAYVTSNNAAVKAAKDAADAAQAAADALEGRMDTAEGDIEDLQEAIAAINGEGEGEGVSLASLAARMTTAEGTIASNTTLAQKGVDDAAAAQAAAEAAQGDVDTLEGTVTTLSGTVASNTTLAQKGVDDAAAAKSAADAAASAASAAQSDVDALEGTVSTLSGTVASNTTLAQKGVDDAATAAAAAATADGKAVAAQSAADAAQEAADAAQETADANAEDIAALQSQVMVTTATSSSEEALNAAAANLVEGGLIIVSE